MRKQPGRVVELEELKKKKQEGKEKLLLSKENSLTFLGLFSQALG